MPASESERQRAEQDHSGPLDRRIERRVGLVDRRFDENVPAERRNRRRGGEHPMALDVLGFADLLGVAAGGGGAGGAHLRQLRHVGIAQHQADVGMRDQPAGGVDHIGAPVPGEFDLRQHVPDQFQIDLGDAHAGVAPRAGERQRHVRFGFAAEIDRAEIDLVRHRLGEARVLGDVVAAADHLHGEPRHPQLLVAARIDLGKLGDRRHLAQQPQRVEAPLLERAGRPRQLRGPADLAFDLADELADLAGGGFGLLALNAHQRDSSAPDRRNRRRRRRWRRARSPTTPTNRVTYLMNSRLRTIEAPDAGARALRRSSNIRTRPLR